MAQIYELMVFCCIFIVIFIPTNLILNKISSYFREPGSLQISSTLCPDYIPFTRKRRRYFVTGSPNLGGTCYFNAVLQNLLAQDILRDYFIESVGERFGPVSDSLRKIFVETSVKRYAIDPRPLFESICTKLPGVHSIDGGNCRKLLHDLVQSLASEEFTSTKTRGVAETKFLDTMFRVEHSVTCTKSGRRCPSVTYNSTLFLMLEVPCSSSKVQSKKTRPVSLESCLDLYMNPEHQTVKRDVSKITLISKAPLILTIEFEQVMHNSGKPDTTKKYYIGCLKFKETLDLKPYMLPDTDGTYEYRLIGLVERIVGCKECAHDVAYVRGNASNGHRAWYRVSDDEVQKVPVEQVLSRKPHILFYERWS